MLYIENKYSKWYWKIISNAKLRNLDKKEYKEKHHILPKSLGGTDCGDNLVNLTAKEHFICHLLLPKMLTDQQDIWKMSYALWQMSLINGRKRYRPSSRIYEIMRKQLSFNQKGIQKSEEHKRKIGLKSKGRKPFLGRKHSEETKQKISKKKIGVSTPKSNAMRKKLSNTRKAMNLNFSGTNNPMYGKTHNLETKKLISEANSGQKNGMFGKYKNSPVIICPHCGKSGKQGPNFIRWHFDKCKENNA